MGYSGAGGKLAHEKNQNKKSRDTVPLILFFVGFYVISGLADDWRWQIYKYSSLNYKAFGTVWLSIRRVKLTCTMATESMCGNRAVKSNVVHDSHVLLLNHGDITSELNYI
jgi:hypothetical protein